MVLVTDRRRESLGGEFERICTALGRIAARFPDVNIGFPVYPNRNVREGVPGLLEILHQ